MALNKHRYNSEQNFLKFFLSGLNSVNEGKSEIRGYTAASVLNAMENLWVRVKEHKERYQNLQRMGEKSNS